MKKRFYIAILVFAAVLAGCAKAEVVPAVDKAVSFQVGSYAPQTKAPEGTASIISIDGIRSFSSRGFLHAEGVEGYQEFFGAAGETITYNGSNAWNPSHAYFWPKSANSYVNFVSWHGGTPTLSYSQVENVWTATFAWSNATVAKTDNYLFADMAWRYNENTKNPATYGFDGVTEGVPTLFHHALAQIRFLGKMTKDSETGVSWAVAVNSLSLAGVYSTGTFTLTNSDPEGKQTKPWTITDWSDLSGSAAIATASDAEAVELEVSDTKVLLGWNSVLPQAVTSDMQLTIDFTVVTTYGTSGPVVEEVVSKTVALSEFSSTLAAWGCGQQITYIVSINPDTQVIKIVPVGKDWVEAGEDHLPVE